MKIVVKMLVTLAVIGVFSGGILSSLNDWAEPKIEANRKAETEKAIFVVQPDASSYIKAETSYELYQVFGPDSSEAGFALPYEGNGFQGKIRLMVGLTPELDRIIGLSVLEQVETPGLGTKVVEDPFTDQFKNLSTNPNVAWVKGAEPSNPNEIQAITGATISSKAIVEILNSGIAELRQTKEGGEL